MATIERAAKLDAVHYHDGVWVALGFNDKGFRSTNGVNWERYNLDRLRNIRGITHGANRWLCAGSDGVIGVSQAGNAWTFTRLNGIGFADNFFDITFGDGTYVAVGERSLIVTISSQLSASVVHSGSGENLNAVTYGEGKFVAVGNRGTIKTSTNGKQWQNRSSGIVRNLLDVAYADGKFMAVEDFGTVLSSADGISWSKAAQIQASGLRGIGFADGHWYLVGGALKGVMYRSRSGSIWTAESIPNVGPLHAIDFGGGKAVAVGIKPTSGNRNFVYANLTSTPPSVPPSILTQPRSVTVEEGEDASFSVLATGTPFLSYQWLKNGSNLSGKTQRTLLISDVSESDAGAYSVRVRNAAGSVISHAATLTVTPKSEKPRILTQPRSVTVEVGADASFRVVAEGFPTPSYQWFKNGNSLAGKTRATLLISDASEADAGDYSVRVRNLAGSVTSRIATLTVIPPVVVPELVGGSMRFAMNDPVREGEEQSVTFEIRNNGEASSPPTLARLYLSLENDWDISSDHLIGDADVPGLAPGEEIELSWTFRFPDMREGEYHVWPTVFLDVEGLAQSANTWKTKSFYMVIPAAVHPLSIELADDKSLRLYWPNVQEFPPVIKVSEDFQEWFTLPASLAVQLPDDTWRFEFKPQRSFQFFRVNEP